MQQQLSGIFGCSMGRGGAREVGEQAAQSPQGGQAERGAPCAAGGGARLGVVNALVRPILLLLTLPFTILTLGLFVLIINAAMLGLVSVFLEDFTLSGFPAAFWGAVVVSLTSWFTSVLIGPTGSVDVMVSGSRSRKD